MADEEILRSQPWFNPDLEKVKQENTQLKARLAAMESRMGGRKDLDPPLLFMCLHFARDLDTNSREETK